MKLALSVFVGVLAALVVVGVILAALVTYNQRDVDPGPKLDPIGQN